MVGEEKAWDRREIFRDSQDGAGCNPNLQSLADDNTAKVGKLDTD
jgi:hypothetical protein